MNVVDDAATVFLDGGFSGEEFFEKVGSIRAVDAAEAGGSVGKFFSFQKDFAGFPVGVRGGGFGDG